MTVPVLGEPRYRSPLGRSVPDEARVPEEIIQLPGSAPPTDGLSFELTGTGARLYFEASGTRAGIVTCGGLCPGLNDVIRSLYLELHYAYGVQEVLGFQNGYQGLDPEFCAEPLVLTRELVDGIHRLGGTVLGTSRGPVDIGRAVENLIRRRVDNLFSIGGDGTQRGGGGPFCGVQDAGH